MFLKHHKTSTAKASVAFKIILIKAGQYNTIIQKLYNRFAKLISRRNLLLFQWCFIVKKSSKERKLCKVHIVLVREAFYTFPDSIHNSQFFWLIFFFRFPWSYWSFCLLDHETQWTDHKTSITSWSYYWWARGHTGITEY